MKPADNNLTQLLQSVEALRSELAALRERMGTIETRLAAFDAAAARPNEPPDEELLSVLAASVAAFLGYKPRIRQIRLIGGASWAQQGRATIQASHVLTHHG